MLYDRVRELWPVFGLLILGCELYVPYRRRLLLSAAAGAGAALVSSCFFAEAFWQCVCFLIFSFLIYTAASAAVFFGRRRRSGNGFYTVIALGDIPEDGYGAVYCVGKSHIIRNPFGKRIKKGEVLRLCRRELEGESEETA